MPRKIRRQRRGRSAFTSIKVSYSTYLTMSSVGGRLAAYATSNIHIQNIMSNLITSTPNVTNFIAAYEFVALKSARVSFTNTGIANFSNSTANSMYPATQAAMFYDPYNNVAGLGGYPALTLSKLPGAVSCLGRGRIVKYMSAALSARTSACRTGSQLPLALPTTMSRQGQVSSRSSLWVSTQLTGSQIRVTARPDYSGSRAHSSSKT